MKNVHCNEFGDMEIERKPVFLHNHKAFCNDLNPLF